MPGLRLVLQLPIMVARSGKREQQSRARRSWLPISRRQRNLTGNALAGKIGMAQSSFSRWYNGKTRLNADNIARLADYLKVALSTIPN